VDLLSATAAEVWLLRNLAFFPHSIPLFLILSIIHFTNRRSPGRDAMANLIGGHQTCANSEKLINYHYSRLRVAAKPLESDHGAKNCKRPRLASQLENVDTWVFVKGGP
jgi:hypothetical protein